MSQGCFISASYIAMNDLDGEKKKKSTRKVKLIRTIATWTCLFCPVKVLVLSRTAKEVERDALAG